MSQASSQRLQILKRYQKGDRNFKDMDLRQVDLSGLRLFQADFSQTNLFGANLAESDLRQAQFSAANLGQANLQNADLQGADFTGANLRRADLGGANIRNARFESAQMTGATMPDWRLSVNSAANGAIAEAVPLQMEAIERDLQKVAKPKWEPAPKEAVPPLVRSFAEVKRDLPYAPLFALIGSCVLMGLQISMAASPATLYLLPPLALLIFYIRPQAANLIPIIFISILLLCTGNLTLLALPILIIIGVVAGMFFVGGNLFANPLRDGLWLSTGLIVFLIVYASSVFFGFAVGLRLILTLMTTVFGCLLPSAMVVKRFQPGQILWVSQSGAIAGVLMGKILGLLV
jgi:hypothetical protein